MAEDLKKVVLEALDVEDPNVLRAACVMAGALEIAQAERALIKALGHKAWQVQAEAARALGRLGSSGAAPFLKRLLKAADAELRQKVLAAAGAPKGGAAEEGEAHPELKRAAAVALNRIQPAVAEEALKAALASGQPALMNAALAGLGNLESTGDRAQMLELLGHEDPSVRGAAAACLGRLREKGAVAGLLKLTGDAEASVRREAIIALNHLKDKQAVVALAHLMDDSDAGVRRVAAIALGNTRHPGPEVVGPLRKCLADRDPSVREASVKALANVHAAEALEAVTELLADSHENVQRAAAQAVIALNQIRELPDYDFS